MKKFFLVAFIALTTVICVASTVANNAAIESDATVEYVIPNVTFGTMSLENVSKIFALMPGDVLEKCAEAYDDIVSNPKQVFTYGGVRVKRTGSDWEFNYQGASVKVHGATNEELNQIFRRGTI